MNTLFPIFLKLDGQPCLVVGGGMVAQRKIEGLLQSHARVTVIAQEANQTIQAWAKTDKIDLLERPYESGDVSGQILVIAATDHQPTNRLIYQEARRANIPVNVVDDPPLCSFYYPAVYQEGELKIAVSTNGQTPVLAKLIRDDIKEHLGGKYGSLIAQVARIREGLFQATPDSVTRKGLIEGIVASMTEGALPSGDPLTAEPTQSAPDQPRRTGPSAPFRSGKVTLVGGGPGDPELITVKGLKAIQQADVIVYDALIDPRLLAHARPGVEAIFVGKRSGQHSAAQELINQLLVSRVQAGLRVVRLKGGDPFIYGRGGEEIAHLAQAGIAFEVIPGVTAGTAAPACAGIPLTSRGTSSSVAFVSGHLCREADDDAVDWSRLAQAVDTLVIYMGVNNRARIARQLIQGGRPPETPVAIIQKGTYPDQRTDVGTLAELVNEDRADRFETPAIIVVGEVVALRSAVHGWERQTGDAGLPMGLAESVAAAPWPGTVSPWEGARLRRDRPGPGAELQGPLNGHLERFEDQRIPAGSNSLTVHSK